MNALDTANNVFVDFHTESQRDLLGDAGATPVEATFQFNDGVSESWIRSFRATLAPALAAAIFGLIQ